jgi:hypothetical protein
MATIVNNPTPSDRTAYTDSGGWAIAIIILLLVIAAGAYLLTHLSAPASVSPNSVTPGSATVPSNTTVNNEVLPGTDSNSNSGGAAASSSNTQAY